MPVPTKLLKAAFAALSTKSLRAAAEYHELEDWETRAPASLVAELGDDDGYNLGTFMYDLKAPELKKVAKALGVEPASSEEGDIQGAIGMRPRSRLSPLLIGITDNRNGVGLVVTRGPEKSCESSCGAVLLWLVIAWGFGPPRVALGKRAFTLAP